LLLVVPEGPFKDIAIDAHEDPLAMPLVLEPLALILAAISADMDASPVHQLIAEVSSIEASVLKGQLPFAMSSTSDPIALIACPLCLTIDIHSHTMPLIMFPITFVSLL
jgi:hypothetical protein